MMEYQKVLEVMVVNTGKLGCCRILSIALTDGNI